MIFLQWNSHSKWHISQCICLFLLNMVYSLKYYAFENADVWCCYYFYECFLYKLQYKIRAFMNQRPISCLLNRIITSYQLQNFEVWNAHIKQPQFGIQLRFLLLLYKTSWLNYNSQSFLSSLENSGPILLSWWDWKGKDA